MLEIFFTIDVEVWCDGWDDIDRKFPDAFDRYIYGPGGQGGLRDQLRMLGDHGQKAVCFVEPLFAGRFGPDPLAEIVGLVLEEGHEVQLHLHTEWVDEARPPLLLKGSGKRQHLHHFSLSEQTHLIAIGAEWLQCAGATKPTAFRAGSFAFNSDSLAALEQNGIIIDASYNASTFGPTSGVCPGERLLQPRQLGQVLELPMTVFNDGRGLRHAQLTACSWGELEHLLWQALEGGHQSFVILSHNFELLTRGQRTLDPVVVRRLQLLCDFVARRGDMFRMRGLRDLPPPRVPVEPLPPLASPLWRTGARMLEQAWRRRYK